MPRICTPNYVVFESKVKRSRYRDSDVQFHRPDVQSGRNSRRWLSYRHLTTEGPYDDVKSEIVRQSYFLFKTTLTNPPGSIRDNGVVRENGIYGETGWIGIPGWIGITGWIGKTGWIGITGWIGKTGWIGIRQSRRITPGSGCKFWT